MSSNHLHVALGEYLEFFLIGYLINKPIFYILYHNVREREKDVFFWSFLSELFIMNMKTYILS